MANFRSGHRPVKLYYDGIFGVREVEDGDVPTIAAAECFFVADRLGRGKIARLMQRCQQMSRR